MNSKQLLLTTALITSLSSIAIADVSISGVTTVHTNYKGLYEYAIQSDITTEFKSGDSSVVAQFGLDNSNTIEQLYVQSSVAGIDVKGGWWKSGKGELGRHYALDGTYRLNASALFGGLKLAYEDVGSPWGIGIEGASISASGTVSGINVTHKIGKIYAQAGSNIYAINETKLVGPILGFDVELHNKDFDTAHSNTAYKISKLIKGVKLTYADINAPDYGTSADGFFGKTYSNELITQAEGLGISTSIAGNQLTFKTMDMIVNGSNDDKNKLTLARQLISGAILKATYVDLESGDDWFDLELAVKF